MKRKEPEQLPPEEGKSAVADSPAKVPKPEPSGILRGKLKGPLFKRLFGTHAHALPRPMHRDIVLSSCDGRTSRRLQWSSLDPEDYSRFPERDFPVSHALGHVLGSNGLVTGIAERVLRILGDTLYEVMSLLTPQDECDDLMYRLCMEWFDECTLEEAETVTNDEYWAVTDDEEYGSDYYDETRKCQVLALTERYHPHVWLVDNLMAARTRKIQESARKSKARVRPETVYRGPIRCAMAAWLAHYQGLRFEDEKQAELALMRGRFADSPQDAAVLERCLQTGQTCLYVHINEEEEEEQGAVDVQWSVDDAHADCCNATDACILTNAF